MQMRGGDVMAGFAGVMNFMATFAMGGQMTSQTSNPFSELLEGRSRNPALISAPWRRRDGWMPAWWTRHCQLLELWGASSSILTSRSLKILAAHLLLR